MKHGDRQGSAELGEILSACAELSDLLAQLGEARHALAQEAAASELVAVNEHLVCSAMDALRDAEDCRLAMIDAQRAARIDELTELPNRVQLMERLANAIALAQHDGSLVALLFIDLDNFERINDAHGHAAGDAALKILAQRLSSHMRGGDIVSRHGGDEFLVLLTGLKKASEAVRTAEELIELLATDCVVDQARLRVRASIGISVFPQDGDDAGQLIARADLAMYQAKRGGVAIGVSGRSRTLREPRPEAQRTALSAAPDPEALNLRLQSANEQLLLAALSSQELASAAEAANRQQREHLAVVAHELRNPLSPIRMAASLLDRLPARELPRMQAIIDREVMNMTRLIGDLLDLARVYTGKLRLERQVVSLEGIVAESIEATRPAMDARRQVFSAQLTGQPLMAYADPVRLAQVFRNLLDNASKYTADGGTIDLSITVADHVAQIVISDTGIGISADALPLIFEPFAQDTHAVGFNGFGLGIGLTVVRELVESHRGTVQAGSAGTGQGSRFVVMLPLSGGNAAD